MSLQIARLQLAGARRYYSIKNIAIAHYPRIAALSFIALCLLVWPIEPHLRPLIQPYLSDKRADALSALLQSVGSQLIGTSALTFGLVTFAMQANLGRTPHNVFARLSTDTTLLGYFLFTFVSSIAVALLSIFVSPDCTVLIAMLATVLMIGILVAIILAFLRALLLVNPTYQIKTIVYGVSQHIRVWDRLARWSAPLLHTQFQAASFDAARMAFQSLNPKWTNDINVGIRQLVAYARQNADTGNIDVSGAALAGVISINKSYVAVKGRTFVADNPFFPVNSTDAVVNESLEQLRQLSRFAATEGAEPLMEQTHGCLASLAIVYADIQYGVAIQSKTHTMLASAYIQDSAKALLTQNYTDVLMDAVRQMGRIGNRLIKDGAFTELASMTDTFALIGATAGLKENHRPVMQRVCLDLSNFLLALLQSPRGDIRFACEHIDRAMRSIAETYIKNPDPSPLGSSYLAPYFGLSAIDGFGSQFTNLCHALAAASEEDQRASRICSNLVNWSDGLYRDYRELLRSAVAARSPLTFDLIHWNETVATGLALASSSEACDDDTREELLDHAAWLAAGLTWVPDEAGAIEFTERYRITERLVTSVANIHSFDRDRETGVLETLIGWGLKTAPYSPGRRHLQECLAGIAIALVNAGEDSLPEDVRTEITRLFSGYLKKHQFDVGAFKTAIVESFVNTPPEPFSIDYFDVARSRLDTAVFANVLDEIIAAIPEQA